MNSKKESDLRSNLARVRGLGSAKHGVSHWWLQRLTAIALIPLGLWLVSSIISVMLSPDVLTVAHWFSSPFNALFMALFIIAMFFHAKLGMQVIIEDYVKCSCMRYGMLIANSFFCLGGTAFCLIAILKIHFLNIPAS
ncbi:MAG: succinate dehydrogenase, hydrophobic membrane anchor protein [Rickettsiales bacterium]